MFAVVLSLFLLQNTNVLNIIYIVIGLSLGRLWGLTCFENITVRALYIGNLLTSLGMI